MKTSREVTVRVKQSLDEECPGLYKELKDTAKKDGMKVKRMITNAIRYYLKAHREGAV